LRTLAFAFRELPDDQVPDYLECELSMLGVTSVEDLLQENVAQSISDFRQAGIKVWMLTGDKGETAL